MSFAHVKLKKDTHFLWTERKYTLCLKSDNELALYLLDLLLDFHCACRDTQQLEEMPVTQFAQFVNDKETSYAPVEGTIFT